MSNYKNQVCVSLKLDRVHHIKGGGKGVRMGGLVVEDDYSVQENNNKFNGWTRSATGRSCWEAPPTAYCYCCQQIWHCLPPVGVLAQVLSAESTEGASSPRQRARGESDVPGHGS